MYYCEREKYWLRVSFLELLYFGEMVYEYLVIVRGVNNKFGKDFKINFCCILR